MHSTLVHDVFNIRPTARSFSCHRKVVSQDKSTAFVTYLLTVRRKGRPKDPAAYLSKAIDRSQGPSPGAWEKQRLCAGATQARKAALGRHDAKPPALSTSNLLCLLCRF